MHYTIFTFFVLFLAGLKDNPLYATSQETKDDSGPVYSIVNKSGKTEKCNVDGPVYSHVQKKTTNGK